MAGTQQLLGGRLSCWVDASELVLYKGSQLSYKKPGLLVRSVDFSLRNGCLRDRGVPELID